MKFTPLQIACLVCVACTLQLTSTEQFAKHGFADLNYLVTRTFEGKNEVRMALDGIVGMEVTIANSSGNNVLLRLVTDGNHILKLIYSDQHSLETCKIDTFDFEESSTFARRFLNKMQSNNLQPSDLLLNKLLPLLDQPGSQVKYKQLDTDTTLIHAYDKIINFNRLLGECRNHQAATRQNINEYHRQQDSRNDLQLRESINDKKSRRFKRREKIIYPGTKWCGTGSISTNYDDLGENRDEDKCCRKHDFCEYMIEGFSTKWGYFNPRLTTISHCDCDDRFFSCLKVLQTTVADLIGDIYFNVAQTQCFEFKKQRKCVSRKWWGGCARHAEQWEVVVNNAMSYNN